jgi:hypothetical protein
MNLNLYENVIRLKILINDRLLKLESTEFTKDVDREIESVIQRLQVDVDKAFNDSYASLQFILRLLRTYEDKQE